MVISKSLLLPLLLTLFLSSAFLSLGFHLKEETFPELIARNPESPRRKYEQCKQECQEEPWGREQSECEHRCEKQYRRKSEEEEERPQKKYEQCRRDCRVEQDERRQQKCQKRCEQIYERRPEEEEETPRKKYEQCRRECRVEQDERLQQKCQKRCERQYERRPEEEEEEPKDPRQRFEQCQEQCQSKHEGRRLEHRQCQTRCQMDYEEQQTGQSPHHRNPQPQEQRNNPFFFHSRTFQSKFKSEHGSLRVLPRFTQKSPLLRGIKNYRFWVMEANPNTFVVPHHCDSEAVLVVIRGQGTFTVVNDERRQSFTLKRGNVITLPVGTTFHLVNSERNEKLMIASVKKSFNAPGEFDEFFTAGGENPQSYYNVFSDEVLEIALNTPRDQIRRLFQEKREEGIFRRASQEQLRALSKESHSSSSKQRETESFSLIDLLNQSPVHSNRNGRFFEANPEEFNQLRSMDVGIGITEMKQGSILVPHYNTKRTTIVLITEGNGRFEMASPRNSEQEEEDEEEQKSGELFRKITARANPGDIFVIPAGFPVTIIASPNENLRAIYFGINAEKSQVIWLAGKNNVVKNMDSEAQELSFGVPAQQVQQVFGKQEESYFVSGDRRQQKRVEV